MTQLRPFADNSTKKPPTLALAGVVILLMTLALRVLVSFDPIPGWGGDPLDLESPIVGLTPLSALIVDGTTLAASALILFSMSRRGFAPPLWQTLCLAAGGVAIWLHAHILRNANLDNLVLGTSWFSAFAGAFAGLQASRHPQLRRLIIATLLGLIAPLAIKGVVQFYIEQPEFMHAFVTDRDRILAAQGWSPGSSMALAYERRLSQPEASGWFGLSNVFSTLAAASLTALLGLLASAWHRRDVPARAQTLASLITGILCAGVGVILAGSKGGFTAAALGVALLILARIALRFFAPSGRTVVARGGSAPLVTQPGDSPAPAGRTILIQRLGGTLSLLIILGALSAVVLRGLVGERIHELSLLFRWFYIQTATHIFAAHPLLGTGPDGFKDAYMLLKPANSPEDVSSPHSIFFDLAARLGLGGLALSALLIAWLWQTGRTLLPTTEPEPTAASDSTPLRPQARLLLIIIGFATVAGAILEQPAATITSTFVRFGGMAGFLAVSIATLRLLRAPASRWTNPALAAAAIAALAHTQIELTGITPGANLWIFLLLAVAAAGFAPSIPAASFIPRFAAPLTPVIFLAVLVTVLPAVISWEQNLRAAASLVAPIPSLQARAQAVKAGKPLQGDTVTALTSELSTALNFRIDPSMAVDAAFELRYRRAVAALPLLLAANTPPDSDTTHAAARLMLQVASMESIRGNPAAAAFGADAAEKLAIDFCASTSPRPSQLAWLGMLREARFERFDHDPAHLRAAITAWEQAVALAPHEPLYTSELARANAALGQREEAAKWAAKSLAINQELHLDPLRQFSQADLDALTALANPTPPHQTPSPPP